MAKHDPKEASTKEPELDRLTVKQLREMAKTRGIGGVAKLIRAELLKLLSGKSTGKGASDKAASDKASSVERQLMRPRAGTESRPSEHAETPTAPLELASAGALESPPPPFIAPPPESPVAPVVPQPAPVQVHISPFLQHEHLGELPQGYGDGTVVCLARDPHTLFVYWDFTEEMLRHAGDGLSHPRAELFLLTHGQLVRRQEIHFDARAWYLHEVEPGRDYRVELSLVGADGIVRRVGRSSNVVSTPRVGPSEIVDDRFVCIPYETPLGALDVATRAEAFPVPSGEARHPHADAVGSSLQSSSSLHTRSAQ